MMRPIRMRPSSPGRRLAWRRQPLPDALADLPLDFHQTHPARAVGRQCRMLTECGNGRARRPRDVQDGGAGRHRHLPVVESRRGLRVRGGARSSGRRRPPAPGAGPGRARRGDRGTLCCRRRSGTRRAEAPVPRGHRRRQVVRQDRARGRADDPLGDTAHQDAAHAKAAAPRHRGTCPHSVTRVFLQATQFPNDGAFAEGVTKALQSAAA